MSVLPADCPLQPTDSAYALVVNFIREGPKHGVDDDMIGIFTLPTLRNCRTAKSIAAHRLISQLMNGLPGTDLRSKFVFFPILA